MLTAVCRHIANRAHSHAAARVIAVRMASTATSNAAEQAPAEAAAATAATVTPAARRIRVYTRTGDKGTSSLYNGERRFKDDHAFGALGDVDELNAAIGLARQYVAIEGSGAGLEEHLTDIQSRLLDAGSAIATPVDTSSPAHLARVEFAGADHAAGLERWIDAMDDALPPLKNFILPGGGLAAAHLHVARTVCRRAERAVTSLHRDGHVGAEVCVYLNRLSDFLFVAARYAAMRAGASETVYKKAVGRTERPLPAASAPAAAGTAGAGDGSVAPAAVAAVTGTA